MRISTDYKTIHGLAKTRVMEFRVPCCRILMIDTLIWWFACIAEKRKVRFLSKAAAARQPVQQPKTQSPYAVRSRYGVLGFIYYGIND